MTCSTSEQEDLAKLRQTLNVEPLLGQVEYYLKKALPKGQRVKPGLNEHQMDTGNGWMVSGYNFSYLPPDRQWIKELLLNQSDEESDKDEEANVDFVLKVHRKCQKWRRQYHSNPIQYEQYQYWSVGMFRKEDPYALNAAPQQPTKKKKKRPSPSVKDTPPRKAKRLQKGKDYEEEWLPLGGQKKIQVEAKKQDVWQFIARKEIPKAVKSQNALKHSLISNAKRLAGMCQKEVKKTALKSLKASKDYQTRAKRLVKEVLVYWKKYERVEKEQRRKAEREAQEQRRLDEEMREAKRQQRKLNFLITQTELCAHFMAKKLTGETDASQDILKQLEDAPLQREVAPGVIVNLEDPEEYDSEVLKAKALANVAKAFKVQEQRKQQFDGQSDNTDLQESFDRNFSLANPSLAGAQEFPQPKMFNGTLKAYQLKGMNWLSNLYNQGINGILADEMGLGKTIQSLAFLANLAEVQSIWGPFLIVTPASTLHNWLQECGRFVTQLTVMPYWGNPQERKTIRKFWNQKLLSSRNSPFHILVTSYQLVVTDVKYFQRVKWQYMILDEAQAIKSSASLRWKILLSFNCRNRLLLTGTPIQNSMAELWALLHFIMPTLFDSHEEFSEWFSKDIESHAERKSTLDENQLSRLHMILKPFMLRRIKRDVENEMVGKVEVEVACGLMARQQQLYKRLRNKISIEELLQTSTLSGSSTKTSSLMNLVMQFRKVCNHPELFERKEVKSPLFQQDLDYQIPRLIYQEGLVCLGVSSRWKLLQVTLSPFSVDHTSKEMHPGTMSALRLAGYSPHEIEVLSGVMFVKKLVLLTSLLHRVHLAYYDHIWKSGKSSPLMMWPFMKCSSASVQCSTVLQDLVFVRPGRVALSHSTISIKPVCSSNVEKMAAREAFQLVEVPQLVALETSKVLAKTILWKCSSRRNELEQMEIARGGPPDLRKVLLDVGQLEEEVGSKWFPWKHPPAGLAAVYPITGWSHINQPDKYCMILDSSKMVALDRLLARLKAEGHKVLIYSQMTKMIDILEDYMQFRRYKYTRLDGSSKISERRDMVEDFQSRADIFVFLLSTRAGGLGINLTAADTVIFYDSDWNPTVDQQAMDRAHRLGQTKEVTVYRLIVKGTIEERILQRAKEKSEIHRMVIQGGEFKSDSLKPREVVSLLLDDDEMETRLLARQMERRQAEEQRRNKKRNRNAGSDDPPSKRATPTVSSASTPTLGSEGSRQSPPGKEDEQVVGKVGKKKGVSSKGKSIKRTVGRGMLTSAAVAGAAAGKLAATNATLAMYGISPQMAATMAHSQLKSNSPQPLKDTPSPCVGSSPSQSTLSSAPGSPILTVDNGTN